MSERDWRATCVSPTVDTFCLHCCHALVTHTAYIAVPKLSNLQQQGSGPMSLQSWKAWAIPLLATCAFVCDSSYAQTSPPLTLVHTVAGANHAVPVEFNFAVTTK